MAVCVSLSLAAGLPVGPNADSLRAKRVVVCGVMPRWRHWTGLGLLRDFVDLRKASKEGNGGVIKDTYRKQGMYAY